MNALYNLLVEDIYTTVLYTTFKYCLMYLTLVSPRKMCMVMYPAAVCPIHEKKSYIANQCVYKKKVYSYVPNSCLPNMVKIAYEAGPFIVTLLDIVTLTRVMSERANLTA